MICQEEGSYYTIKGFLYQYDKAILEILSRDEEVPVYIERIQDIDCENYVVQVKHKLALPKVIQTHASKIFDFQKNQPILEAILDKKATFYHNLQYKLIHHNNVRVVEQLVPERLLQLSSNCWFRAE